MQLDERGRQALQSRTAQALWDVLLKREPQPITPAAPLPAEIQEGLEGRRGSLVVVGTGIRTVGHMTVEALAWIRIADAMFFLVADPIAEAVIRELNPGRPHCTATTAKVSSGRKVTRPWSRR